MRSMPAAPIGGWRRFWRPRTPITGRAPQILDDPDGERDWRITAAVDLEASDEAGEPVLTTLAVAPFG